MPARIQNNHPKGEEMKATLKLIILLTYTIAVFFIENYIVLSIIALLNIILMLLFKVPKLKALKNIYFLSFFILFTAVINLLVADATTAILIAVRLVLVCNFTYTYTFILSPMEFAKAIETLLFPLKIFRINPEDIGLIINIALTFIPILSNELSQIKYALKAKGITIGGINTIKSLKYMMKPLLYGILKRTSDLEYALKSKGYTEL